MKIARLLTLTLILFPSLIAVSAVTDSRPQRAIIFQINGLSYQAAERLHLEHILTLQHAGSRVAQAITLPPVHPDARSEGQPGPALLPDLVSLTGTVLLNRAPRMLQESFEHRYTAQIANSADYAALSTGFTYTKLEPGMRDKDVVAVAKQVIQEYDPAFMHLVLQDSSRRLGETQPDNPDPATRLIERLQEADRQLGDFIHYLKTQGKWEDTLFVLQSNGATEQGHPSLLTEEASRIPLIFHGPGIAPDKTIPYAETIDVTATIAEMMGVAHPNPDEGSGRILTELAPELEAPQVPRLFERLNQALRQQIRLQAHMILAADQNPDLDLAVLQLENGLLGRQRLYGLRQVRDWKQTGSLKALTEYNEQTARCMQQLLDPDTGPRTPAQPMAQPADC